LVDGGSVTARRQAGSSASGVSASSVASGSRLPYAIRQARAWMALIDGGSPARAGRTRVVALVAMATSCHRRQSPPDRAGSWWWGRSGTQITGIPAGGGGRRARRACWSGPRHPENLDGYDRQVPQTSLPTDLGVLADRVFAAILFDMDGTLIDSTPSVNRSWSRWALEFGVDLTSLAGMHGIPAAQIAAA
jgi:hypothetical protein